MELYQLEHPPDRILLCTHSDCNEISDYLELTEDGGNEGLCASHTSSEEMTVAAKGAALASWKETMEYDAYHH
jgi:hypothetical protein